MFRGSHRTCPSLGHIATLSRSAIVSRLRAAGSVFAEDEARLLLAERRTPTELATAVRRRAAGEPLEHMLGWAEFCGLQIAVGPGVFVPRRRTELLARRAIERAEPGAVVVDLCCGSGAVGVAVAKAVDGVELHAVDLDPDAVSWARRNVPAGGHVYEGDLYDPLPGRLRSRVDVLVANAPYVPSEELGLMPVEAREHEPRMALDGGPDGLGVLRRVADGASRWLAPGGSVLVEASQEQAPTVAAALTRHGLGAKVASDANLEATVITGTRASER